MDAQSKLLEIGKIVNTHGLLGEVKLTPWCDDLAIFDSLKFLCDENENRLVVKSVRLHKDFVMLKFEGYDDISKAEELKNKVLFVPREALGELPEGVYYIADILGLDVYDDKGSHLGTIYDFIETGSNNVYIVRRSQGEDILLPAIDDVIKLVDIENRKMIVTLIEGLI